MFTAMRKHTHTKGKVLGVLGIFLAAALLLAGCGASTDGAPSGQAKVKVQVAFPHRTAPPPRYAPFGQDAVQLGVPPAAESAVVKVYSASSNTLVASLTLTRTQSAGSVTVASGADYRFEVSVKDANGLEVAWDERTETINGDTTISLTPKAIIRSVQLWAEGAPISAGDKAKVYLRVFADAAGDYFYQVPDSDFNVTWSVASGGSLDPVNQSRLGAEVSYDGTSTKITVTAQVSGLSETHQQTTIQKSVDIFLFQGSGNAATLSDQLPGWLGPSNTYVSLYLGATPWQSTGVGVRAAVDGAGNFSLPFPSGSDLAANQTVRDHASEVFFQLQSFLDSCSNPSWTQAPTPAVISFAYFGLLHQEGASYPYIGSAKLHQQGGDVYSKPVYLVYSDRDAHAVGQANCGGGILNFDMNFQAGWNLWVADYSGTSPSIHVSPLPSDPYAPSNDGYQWYVKLTRTDLALEASNTSYSPVAGQPTTITFDLKNRLPYGSDPGTITLQFTYNDAEIVIDSASVGTWDSATKQLQLDAPAPGQIQPVSITLTPQSGAAGGTVSLDISLNYPDDLDASNNSLGITLTPSSSSGNSSVGVGLDMESPSVMFQSPSPYAHLNKTVPIAVEVQAFDNIGIVELELYVGFRRIATLQDFSPPQNDTDIYTYSWDASGFSPGRYTLTAIAYDATGNSSRAELEVRLQ